MKQAIIVKYLQETNTLPHRIKASARAGSVTQNVEHIDYSISSEERVRKAVDALLKKLNCKCKYELGVLPNGDYVAVMLDQPLIISKQRPRIKTWVFFVSNNIKADSTTNKNKGANEIGLKQF